MGISVIGSANADLTVQVERRPDAGETLLGSDLLTSAGGKGANHAAAAALLGAEVRFYGCVGADANGAVVRASLLAAGVHLEALEVTAAATGCALILATPDGENSIVVAPGANRLVNAEYLARHPQWLAADVVVMQHEVPLETISRVAATCRERRLRFILNAAPAAPIAPEVLAVCDPLVVNAHEAAVVAGLGADELPARRLAELLVDLGARSVVVTLGAAGSIGLDTTGGFIQQDAEPVAAVDTTGAGDAFVGALASALDAGRSLAEAMALGTRVSAVVVQRAGAQTSYPRLDELR
ncbi:MAG: ribokinase [Brooklawnia sp.]|uniref:ribokinase n=1 Tax=Brooklawnia sp. TaxID=2699740 RepID=UPI003C775A96